MTRPNQSSRSWTCPHTEVSGFRSATGGQPGIGGHHYYEVDQPNTPNANFIAGIDAFTLAPDEWASKVHEIPGEVVAFMANPEQPPLDGIQVFFTIHGRTD